MSKKLISCKTCGAQIAKNSKVCPSCGAPNKKRHPIIGIIIILLGLAMIGAAIGGNDSDAPKVTLEAFNSLETGMSYDEVVEIIGFDGELNSQVDIGAGDEFKTELYTWKNQDGTNMNATFQGGQLVSKAQIGLK